MKLTISKKGFELTIAPRVLLAIAAAIATAGVGIPLL
jgi:hypothetical protein